MSSYFVNYKPFKFISLVMLLVFFTYIFLNCFCLMIASATGIDIAIKDFSTSIQGNIYKNASFDLTINVYKNTDLNFKDIFIEIADSSDFYCEKVNLIKLTDDVVADINTLGLSQTKQISNIVKLIYKGTGNKLIINFSYTFEDGKTGQFSQTLYIKNAVPEERTPSQPQIIDTSKLIPNLSIADDAMQVLTAGKKQTLKFNIKNSSLYSGVNVRMQLEMEDKSKAANIFDVPKFSKNIDYVQAGETKAVSFDVNVLNTAPDGIHPLRVTFSGENGFGDIFTYNDTLFVKIENDNPVPKLTIQNMTLASPIKPGDRANLTFRVKNITSIPVKSVKITFNSSKQEGFSIVEGLNTRFAQKIDSYGFFDADFNVILSQSAQAPSQPVELKIEYKDTTGAAYAEDIQIFIPVEQQIKEETKGIIKINNIVSPQSEIKPNNDFTVAFDLENVGFDDVRNIKIVVSGESVIVPKTLNNLYCSEIKPGKREHFEVVFFATSDAATKNYPISINVEYEQGKGSNANKAAFSQYIGVLITNKNGADNQTKSSTPRIIINKFNFGSQDGVKAGQEFILNLSFLNTSKISDVNNIKITVNSSDGAFVPVEGVNTFFADTIPVKSAIERSIKLRSKHDLEQKPYIISVNFEYEDSKGNQFTSSENISIPVVQNTRLTTGQIMMPPELMIGQPMPVMIDFYNMGKTILYNLTVKAEGDFDAQNVNYFVGNFEPGRSDSYEAQIVPNKAGDCKGYIVFEFEDSLGNKSEIRKEFAFKAIEMQHPDFQPEGFPDKPVNPQPNKTSNLYLILGAIGAVIVIGIAALLIIRKNIKRRKELTFDE